MSLVRAIVGLIAHRRRRRLGLLLAVAVALGVVAGGLWWQDFRTEVGEPSQALGDAWHVGHRVLDAKGRVLRELPGEEGRRGRMTPLSEIGERLIVATLVIGCVLLAPSIIVGYAVKAAEREDRERGL